MGYNYGAGHLPKKVIVNPQDVDGVFKDYICEACVATCEECQEGKFRYTIGQGSKLSSGCLAYVRNQTKVNNVTVYAADNQVAEAI